MGEGGKRKICVALSSSHGLMYSLPLPPVKICYIYDMFFTFLFRNMLKSIIILLIIGILTALPAEIPREIPKDSFQATGIEDLPGELVDIVTSKFTTTEDLQNAHIALASKKPRGAHKRLEEYRSLCGLKTFGKDLTLRFGDYSKELKGEISKECCHLIRETAWLFRRIEFHGIDSIMSGDKCIPKGIIIFNLYLNDQNVKLY